MTVAVSTDRGADPPPDRTRRSRCTPSRVPGVRPRHPHSTSATACWSKPVTGASRSSGRRPGPASSSRWCSASGGPRTSPALGCDLRRVRRRACEPPRRLPDRRFVHPSNFDHADATAAGCHADLRRARLDGCVLDGAELAAAGCSATTRWPTGFEPPVDPTADPTDDSSATTRATVGRVRPDLDQRPRRTATAPGDRLEPPESSAALVLGVHLRRQRFPTTLRTRWPDEGPEEPTDAGQDTTHDANVAAVVGHRVSATGTVGDQPAAQI